MCRALQEERRYISRYIRGAWGPTWCSMLGKNMFACIEDTSAGVRKPRTSTDTPPAPKIKAAGRTSAAQTWPYSSEEEVSDSSGCPRRPVELGNVDPPVAVPPAPCSGGSNDL